MRRRWREVSHSWPCDSASSITARAAAVSGVKFAGRLGGVCISASIAAE